MIKLKSLLTENIRFDNNDTLLVIPTMVGEFKAGIFKYIYKNQIKYNWYLDTPPDHYRDYDFNGKIHKMAVGGTRYSGRSGINIEQIYAELSNKFKELNLPYVHVSKLKIFDRTTPEEINKSKEFLNKLQSVASKFNTDSENKPKQFGSGPPEFGQWITKDEIKNGRLNWVIENYGDFWLVIKWSISPRQVIKASILLKNYDNIIRGKEANEDYAREIFIKNNPFEGI